NTAGSVIVGGGLLTVDGARAGTQDLFTPSRSLQFVATFSSDPFEHVGFGTDFSAGTPWAIFSTRNGNELVARTSDGSTSQETLLATALLNGSHTFQIDWTSSTVTYIVDSVTVATHTIPMTASMRPLVGDANLGGGSVVVDSMLITPPGTDYQFSGSTLPSD